jgi:hypothetical protein
MTKLLARGGVALCVAAAVGVGGVYYVKAERHLDDAASTNSALAYDDRELAGGNSVLGDQAAAYEARAVIPSRASYRVVVGPGLRAKTELTDLFVEGWFHYFLMPRRPRQGARWVICYGCDRTGLGGVFEARWHDEGGISIGRLR